MTMTAQQAVNKPWTLRSKPHSCPHHDLQPGAAHAQNQPVPVMSTGTVAHVQTLQQLAGAATDGASWRCTASAARSSAIQIQQAEAAGASWHYTSSWQSILASRQDWDPHELAKQLRSTPHGPVQPAEQHQGSTKMGVGNATCATPVATAEAAGASGELDTPRADKTDSRQSRHESPSMQLQHQQLASEAQALRTQATSAHSPVASSVGSYAGAGLDPHAQPAVSAAAQRSGSNAGSAVHGCEVSATHSCIQHHVDGMAPAQPAQSGASEPSSAGASGHQLAADHAAPGSASNEQVAGANCAEPREQQHWGVEAATSQYAHSPAAQEVDSFAQQQESNEAANSNTHELTALWQALREAQADAAAERSARAEAASQAEGLRARLESTHEAHALALADIDSALQTDSTDAPRSDTQPNERRAQTGSRAGRQVSAVAVAMQARTLVQRLVSQQWQVQAAQAAAQKAQDAEAEVRVVALHSILQQSCCSTMCSPVLLQADYQHDLPVGRQSAPCAPHVHHMYTGHCLLKAHATSTAVIAFAS